MTDQEVIKTTVSELMSLLTTDYSCDVDFNEELETYNVLVESDKEAGLMIGNRGRVIESLQTVLSLIVRNKLGKWVNLNVDVAGWKKREEKRLYSLADQAVERAIQTSEAQPLYNLTPAQRRMVHLYLSSRTDIKTESVGEGLDRYLSVVLTK